MYRWNGQVYTPTSNGGYDFVLIAYKDGEILTTTDTSSLRREKLWREGYKVDCVPTVWISEIFGGESYCGESNFGNFG